MTLKIAANPTFWAPVEISVPGQDKPARIQVQFKHLARDAAQHFIESAEGRSDPDLLADIVCDWKQVDKPYSPDALAELLQNYPAAGSEIFRAWMRELVGSKAKN